MRTGQGFVLVYSITEKKSLEELTSFRDQILRVKDTDHVPLVIIGNKCDLESERQIQKSEAQTVAKNWGIPFFEGSAKAKINVEETFFELVREVRKELAKKVDTGKDKKKKEKKGCSIL